MWNQSLRTSNYSRKKEKMKITTDLVSLVTMLTIASGLINSQIEPGVTCGGIPFNKAHAKCCNGTVRALDQSCDLCGGKPYNVFTETCCRNKPAFMVLNCDTCNGTIMHGVSRCCDNKLTPGFTCELGTCIGGKRYNTYTEKCCATEPVPRFMSCLKCNGTRYNEFQYHCCDGKIVSRAYPCGKITMCGEKKLSFNMGCCNGQVYSKRSEWCCDGRVQSVPCQMCDCKPYDEATQSCCDDKIVLGRGCTESACPDGTRYNTLTHKCCGNTVVQHYHSCTLCNGKRYHGGYQKCCGLSAVNIKFACTLCGGSKITEKFEECCDGKTVWKGTCPSNW